MYFLSVLERLKEPSSWAGIALLITIFAPEFDGAALDALISSVAALCAALAILLKEKPAA